MRKVNETYIQLINQALPIEVQQEMEKERLSREKGTCARLVPSAVIAPLCLGTFSENYEDVPPSAVDGSYPATPPTSSATAVNSSSNSLSNNSTVNNSQAQSSAFCTISKRSAKVNQPDGLSAGSSSALVQSSTRNNKPASSSASTSNGHDDGSSSYKQQKKQSQKSASTQPPAAATQSRRQAKKQEQPASGSRDSSSHVNGFTTSISIDNSDIEKK